MKPKLEKSEELSEPGRAWLFVRQAGVSLPEGPETEWRELVHTLLAGATHYRAGRRLAAALGCDGRLRLWSPRNSAGPWDEVRIPAVAVSEWLDDAARILASAPAPSRLS